MSDTQGPYTAKTKKTYWVIVDAAGKEISQWAGEVEAYETAEWMNAAYTRGASEMREAAATKVRHGGYFESGSEAQMIADTIRSLPLVPGQAARGTTR